MELVQEFSSGESFSLGYIIPFYPPVAILGSLLISWQFDGGLRQIMSFLPTEDTFVILSSFDIARSGEGRLNVYSS